MQSMSCTSTHAAHAFILMRFNYAIESCRCRLLTASIEQQFTAFAHGFHQVMTAAATRQDFIPSALSSLFMGDLHCFCPICVGVSVVFSCDTGNCLSMSALPVCRCVVGGH